MDRGGKEGGLGSMELLGSGDLLVLEKGEGMEGEEVGEGEGEGEGEGYLLCKSLFSPLSCSSAATQMMLCFGGGCEEEEAAVMTNGVPRKSTDFSLSTICSSPPSSNITCSSSMASRKLEFGGGRGGRRATAAAAPSVVTSVTSKKTKTGVSARAGTIKAVRKEKLGDRISALQQLVSPFGKSDTASVLHEALGYINFLHDQVLILSSPYLQRLPSSAHLHDGEGGPRRNDLRSRGLCLFPVSCMEHMANSSSNGADLWAPAIRSGNQPFDPEH